MEVLEQGTYGSWDYYSPTTLGSEEERRELNSLGRDDAE